MSQEAYTPGVLSVGIEPHLFVVFGGTGDLARQMLLPALFQLLRRREFHDSVELLAVATRPMSDAEYRKMAVEALAEAGVPDCEEWAERHLRYQSIKDGFEALRERIEEIEAAEGLDGNRAFYLAIPPAVFDDTVDGLGKSGAFSGGGWTRVVVEKPFGFDLDSAHHLNALLHDWLDESQIFRIDHYLAKETVQNLLALRFANPLFESSWSRDRIDSVQITVAEDFGIGSRAGYFDKAGIVRDIIQNHALQVLTLVAMEPPVKATSDAIRDEKVKVLRAMYPVDPTAAVRGQYGEGEVGGEKAAAYLEEEGVGDGSTTETYAAFKFEIDNWRWKGVPFYVRTGKRLKRRVTQVSVVFKEPPVFLFSIDGPCSMHPNVFDIRLQPEEGFALSFEMKVPGEGYDLRTQRLRFDYDEEFGELPGAYFTLLADVMIGDQTLFVRSDEVEEAWRIVAPVLDPGTTPDLYEAGSWGPARAEELLGRSGRQWQTPDF
ncbi:MAG TPA: glucose-6-phosphate dehydrogenase [Acidimicrobiia bacterium]|nr:glucose-6-phosphate dehydrogenase [Acidimicrobiia bacterium]